MVLDGHELIIARTGTETSQIFVDGVAILDGVVSHTQLTTASRIEFVP